nr:hypothetical protein [uncultured Ruegeria sp.]
MIKTILTTLCLVATASGAQALSWKYEAERDQLTGQTYSFAYLYKSQPDLSANPEEIYVRCDGGELDIFVTTNYYWGSSSDVLYRVDNGEVRKVYGSEGTEGDAIFLEPKKQAYSQLIRDLQTAKQLVVRVEDFRGTEFTTTFGSISNQAAVSKVMRQCLGG